VRFWDPVRALTRKRTPAVVMLTRPTAAGSGLDSARPADVYAAFLQEEQWGLKAQARTEEPRIWPSGRLGGGGGTAVNTGPITAEELATAMAEMKANKAPGPDELPAEAWQALDQAMVA